MRTISIVSLFWCFSLDRGSDFACLRGNGSHVSVSYSDCPHIWRQNQVCRGIPGAIDKYKYVWYN